MRKKTSLALILLLFCLRGLCQITDEKIVLKSGKHSEEYELADGKYKKEGIYNIVSKKEYQIIEDFGANFYDIKYKNAMTILSYNAQLGDSLSVKDGLWKTFDEKENLSKETYWMNGINVWSKEYDLSNNLIEYDYDDFENDTNFYLTYRDRRLFKKSYYPPNDKNHATTFYYPESGIAISNAELYFYTNMATYNTDSTSFSLSAVNKSIEINAINCSTKSIKILDKNNNLIKFPLTIKKGETKYFTLPYTPDPISLKNEEIIKVNVSGLKDSLFDIYCNTRAAHIDGASIRHQKNLTLSRIKDRFLIIKSMGTVTTAFIQGDNIEERVYDIRGLTKIDLLDFEAGIYDLSIGSCDNGGFLKLIIEK